jgi:hypothetical protein
MGTGRELVWAAACALSVLAAAPASASDRSDVNATVEKWVDDFNKADMKSLLAACAPHTSIVDDFPPYAWQTCIDWMNDYQANNKVIQLTSGKLSIGKPVYTELRAVRAYMIYPATFSDKEKRKSVAYHGTWTLILQKTPSGWVFTGSAATWGGNYSVRNRW